MKKATAVKAEKQVQFKKKISDFGKSLNVVEERIFKSHLKDAKEKISGFSSDGIFENDFKTLVEKIEKLLA